MFSVNKFILLESIKCKKCNGTGHVILNGKPEHLGKCYNCNGLGFKIREMKSDTKKFSIEIHTQSLNLTTVTTLHDVVMEIYYDEVKVFFNNKWLAGFQRNPEILYSDIKLDVDFVRSISNMNNVIFADKIKETILEHYE